MTALSIPESKRLIELEKAIKRGKETFVEVGLALAEIRDAKLYKADHDTFEDYCRDKWGFKKSYAYQLIDSAKTVASLPDEMSAIVDNEAQARELTKVEPEKREEVLEVASESGPITAKSIKEAAESVTSPAPPTESQEDKEYYETESEKMYAVKLVELVDYATATATLKQLRVLLMQVQVAEKSIKAAIAKKEIS